MWEEPGLSAWCLVLAGAVLGIGCVRAPSPEASSGSHPLLPSRPPPGAQEPVLWWHSSQEPSRAFPRPLGCQELPAAFAAGWDACQGLGPRRGCRGSGLEICFLPGGEAGFPMPLPEPPLSKATEASLATSGDCSPQG